MSLDLDDLPASLLPICAHALQLEKKAAVQGGIRDVSSHQDNEEGLMKSIARFRFLYKSLHIPHS